MQAIAADLGYSETAFLFPRDREPNVYDVRFFAPEQEVPFCGHATIASGVALVERHPAEELVFHTPAGLVTVNTERTDPRAGGRADQRLAPRAAGPAPGLVGAGARGAGLARRRLDPGYPVRLANAGADIWSW